MTTKRHGALDLSVRARVMSVLQKLDRIPPGVVALSALLAIAEVLEIADGLRAESQTHRGLLA